MRLQWGQSWKKTRNEPTYIRKLTRLLPSSSCMMNYDLWRWGQWRLVHKWRRQTVIGSVLIACDTPEPAVNSAHPLWMWRTFNIYTHNDRNHGIMRALITFQSVRSQFVISAGFFFFLLRLFLHWAPHQIRDKIAICTFKAINNGAPPRLSVLLRLATLSLPQIFIIPPPLRPFCPSVRCVESVSLEPTTTWPQ